MLLSQYSYLYTATANKTSKYNVISLNKSNLPLHIACFVKTVSVALCWCVVIAARNNHLKHNTHSRATFDFESFAERLNSNNWTTGNFVVRRTRTRFADSSFTVAGPAAWNSLPVHIRTIQSHSAFCRCHLKTHLFANWLNCINIYFSCIYYLFLCTYYFN